MPFLSKIELDKVGFGLSGSDWDERFALCFFLSLTPWKWAKILPHYDTSSAVPGLIQRRIICSFEQAQDLWRFYWSKTYFLNIVPMVLIRDELEISHLSQIGRCWPKLKHPISQWELSFMKLELLSDPTRKLDVRKFNSGNFAQILFFYSFAWTYIHSYIRP